MRVVCRLAICVLMATGGAVPASAQSSVWPYPTAPDLPHSSTYHVVVNGVDVPVSRYQGHAIAWFAFSGTAEVTVRVSEAVESYQLSPKAYAIPTAASGSAISFTLVEPRKLVLHKVNTLTEHLFLFADAPEADVPILGADGVFNAQSYGADPAGTGNAAPGLQQAIDAASQYAGGGVAFVPAGTYDITSSVWLRSHTTLYLAPGAVIRVKSGSYSGVALPIQNTVNALIRGRGVIYAENSSLCCAQVQTYANTNLHLHDVMFLAAPATLLRFGYDVNSGAHNIKVLAGGPNLADGIDFDGAFAFVLEDSFVWSTDDSIAVGSGTNALDFRRPVNTDGLIIRRNLFYQTTEGHLLSVVPHLPWQYMRNILLEGNTSITVHVAVGLYPSDGQVVISGIVLRNNRFEDIRHSLLDVRSIDFFPWGGCANGFINHESGAVHGVLFDDNVIDVAPPGWSVLWGTSATRNVDSVTINRLYIGDTLVTNAWAIKLFAAQYASNVQFTDVASPPLPEVGPTPTTALVPYVDNSVCPGTAGAPLPDPS